MSDCSGEAGLDPRVRRTRRLLLEAFDGLSREKTIQSITVGDITARADVNRATFYAHFPDKFALFEHAVRERFREVLSAQVPCPTTFKVGHLRGLVQSVAEFLSGMAGQCKKSNRQFEPLVEATLQSSLHQFALAWWDHDADVRRPDVARTTFAGLLSWSIFGAALQWSRGDRTLAAAEFARQVEELLLEGLRCDVRV